MDVSKWTGLFFNGIIPEVISRSGTGCRKPKVSMWVICSHLLNDFNANVLFRPWDKSCNATYLAPMVFLLQVMELGHK